MTTKNNVARRKISLLKLASELENVSKACQIMGYSRHQFYEIRQNFQTYCAKGLIDRRQPRGPHPNRTNEAVGKTNLDFILQYPSTDHWECLSNWL